MYLGLNWRIGATTLVSLNGQTGGNGAGAGVSLQRSLQSGDGLGYSFSQGSGGQVRSNDILQWQTERGLYQAAYFQDGLGPAPLLLSA
ncbi:MAG: hypothetical protein M3Z37_01645, partial [Candidatus Eremiobacteraeota bacterium]|nr:hypothetical protein [Candidatus Eremiobacteraeota bacterium]